MKRPAFAVFAATSILALVWLFSVLSWFLNPSVSLADERDVQLTTAAREVADAIRREALLPPRGLAGRRPLPLVSHWNTGTVEGTFTPDHQISLIQQGHHVLPWMSWPSGDLDSDRFDAYYGRLLSYFEKLDLPISIRGTQWNAMLVGKRYRDRPLDQWAGTVAPDGKRVRRLSPFGAAKVWEDPAEAYIDTAAMKRAQEIYPDPPLVLFVSNNEPPDLRWAKHGPIEEESKRFVDRYGKGTSDSFKRKVFSEGWKTRYSIMFQAMRERLTNDVWKKNVRFVGYGAFGPSHFGRWDGWKVYSLITDDSTDPHWHYWDGGSPSYYTHNWSDIRDHWMLSTQVESMNWVFMLEEAWEVNPDFWFEMSTWDGNEVNAWMKGLGVDHADELVRRSSEPLAHAEQKSLDPKLVKKSKTLQYMQDGQDHPPARTAGWVQFGMWLLRPRVVREFRSHTTSLEPVKPYWMETVRSVDRVHENQTLTDFWRHGKLVANTAQEHPFQFDIPAKYSDAQRWFLLDTDLDPPRPWDQKTNLPVFSLALVRGEAGARQWLVYAHSPLTNRQDVTLTIPNYGDASVDVSRAGNFYLVKESDRSVTPIR